MKSKFIGGTLIVVGTCIGAGLLALPVSTAPGGFINSVILMIGSWIIMSFGAFFILEAAQWLPRGSNLISMGRATLGKTGEVLSWFLYLLLCYSLLCAYISGGSDIFHSVLKIFQTDTNQSIAAVIFVFIFGSFVYKGIKHMDIVNRLLMLFKFITFFLLIFFIAPHVKLPYLLSGENRYIVSAVMITITSFGFAIVIPSLLDYFHGDVKKVRYIIFCGTLIPLACYLIWNFITMGTIPRSGSHGLLQILHSGNVTSGLVASLKEVLNLSSIAWICSIFASICIITSFLGVSLSLSHFIADGFKIKNTGTGKIKICALTFLPPLFITIFFPKIFIIALSYAGIVVVLLLVLLPVAVVWNGRYVKKISNGYRVFGGKFSLIFVAIAGILMLITGILESLHI